MGPAVRSYLASGALLLQLNISSRAYNAERKPSASRKIGIYLWRPKNIQQTVAFGGGVGGSSAFGRRFSSLEALRLCVPVTAGVETRTGSV